MASNFRKPSKKTAIIAAISVITLLAVAVTGTVVFLKDRGTTEAADLEAQQANRQENVATANNNQETPAEQNTPNEGTEGLPAENGDVAGNADNAGNAGTAGNVGNAGTTTTTAGNAVAGANNGNATTTDNIQETTITRNETVYTENPWETQDVTWRPMAVNAELASANADAEQPDFTVTKVADKTIAQVGEKITYTITVTSKQELKGIEVKDVIPAGTKYEEADNEATVIKDGETVKGIIWRNVDLKKSGFLGGIFSDEYKAELKLTVTVTEEAKEIGTISNVAVANGKETDEPTKTSLIETAKTSVITREDKQVEAPAKVGDKITYTITVDNKGEVAGTATIKDEDLKNILADGKAEMVGNVTIKGTEKTVSADELIKGIEANIPANGKVEVVFTVEVKKVDGQIKNVATIDDVPTKPEEVETVNVDVLKEVKEIKRNGEKVEAPAKLNDTIYYNITVTNTGSVEKEVKVSDILTNNNVSLSLFDGETAVSTITLKAGEKKVLTASYTVKQTDINAQAELKNVATIKYDNEEKTDDVPTTVEKANPTYEVNKTAELIKGKGNEAEKAEVGDTIKYVVTVTNTGNVDLTGIEVTDAKLDKTAKVDVTVAEKSKVAISENYLVTVEDVNNKTEIKNVVTTKRDGEDGPKDETTTDVEVKKSYDVEKTAKLIKAKGNKAEKAEVGDTILYVITVTNTGNTDLTGIEVTDSMLKKTVTVDVTVAEKSKVAISESYEVKP